MSDVQIIYASQPFGFDESVLSSILSDARRLNSHDGITGALVCRRDLYLQLLEGPEALVEATYQRICRDDRHVNVQQLVREPISQRLFANWDMLHDPAHSWHWTVDEVHNGALDKATEDEIKAVFEKLAVKAMAKEAG